MKALKFITFSLLSITTASAVWGQTQQLIKLSAPPAGSGIDQSYDEASNTYTLYVRQNNFNDVVPTIEFEPLAGPIPENLRTIAFEYMSDTPVGWEILRLEKMYTGKISREYNLYYSVAPSDQWQTMRIPVGEYRDARTLLFGSRAGQVVKWTWRDLVTGATMKMRNIRYEVEELPYKDIDINAGTTVVEAEDYLLSPNLLGGVGRQSTAKLRDYKSPVNAGEFPLMAWTGYAVNHGSPEEMEKIKQGYRWMAEAGFNLTQGMNYAGCNMAALFDGLEVNGYYVDLLPDDVNLKLLIDPGYEASEIAKWVPRYKESPRLAGYYIRDEPFAQHISQMVDKCNNILQYDDTRFLYGNLFAKASDARGYGFNSWDHYVHTYLESTGMSYLSYDIYPIHEDLASGEIYLMPEFFENLEIANRLCRYYNIPFWAFVHACSNVFSLQGYAHPIPTEERMRMQAFSNLAYGAQALAYYPYVTPSPWAENIQYGNGPISYETGERTPTWYYCQSINREIQALSWVFLGAELLNAGHTNAVVPQGCRALTAAMLPDGVKSVSSDGAGLCVTVLQNERNKFLMVVNTDVNNAQNVSLTTSRKFKRVLADGTTADLQAGELAENLPVGGYILLLVDDNAEPIVHYCKAGSTDIQHVPYRDDVNRIIIGASDDVSNGHYIANMGADSWESYSNYMAPSQNCVISRDEAQANWGSTFSYIVNVPSDIDVNISVGHSVPWNLYGPVAAIGARPGFTYIVDGEPELNWPSAYAASMTLSVDGEVITPANQTARPVAPSAYDPDGAEFNRILADKSLWTPTAVNGKPSDVLYFWPKAGGDNELAIRYNEHPDYVAVHLSAGLHKITVKSLSYPWHFDALRITDTVTSGIDNISVADADSFSATGTNGGVLVQTEGNYAIYNMAGIQVAVGNGSAFVELPAGLYIAVSGKTSAKVLVK